MTQITERIFICGAETTMPEGEEVTGLLCVAVDLDRQGFDGEYNKVGLVDGPGNLPGALMAAVFMLQQMLERNQRVIVCCHGSESRSVIVVAIYIASRSKTMTLEEAINLVKSKHPEAEPCQALRELGTIALRHLRPSS